MQKKKYPYKHGMTDTKFYNAWRGMLKRTTLKSRIDYKDYGGRGITVCRRWQKFENLKKDMYLSFKVHCQIFGEKNTSIDRLDNNKNYKPSNCAWSTSKQQARNRRGNHLVTYKGETKTLVEWSSGIGITATSFRDRITKLGWSVEKAIKTPRRNYPKSKTKMLKRV